MIHGCILKKTINLQKKTNWIKIDLINNLWTWSIKINSNLFVFFFEKISQEMCTLSTLYLSLGGMGGGASAVVALSVGHCFSCWGTSKIDSYVDTSSDGACHRWDGNRFRRGASETLKLRKETKRRREENSCFFNRFNQFCLFSPDFSSDKKSLKKKPKNRKKFKILTSIDCRPQ